MSTMHVIRLCGELYHGRQDCLTQKAMQMKQTKQNKQTKHNTNTTAMFCLYAGKLQIQTDAAYLDL